MSYVEDMARYRRRLIAWQLRGLRDKGLLPPEDFLAAQVRVLIDQEYGVSHSDERIVESMYALRVKEVGTKRRQALWSLSSLIESIEDVSDIEPTESEKPEVVPQRPVVRVRDLPPRQSGGQPGSRG